MVALNFLALLGGSTESWEEKAAAKERHHDQRRLETADLQLILNPVCAQGYSDVEIAVTASASIKVPYSTFTTSHTNNMSVLLVLSVIGLGPNLL